MALARIIPSETRRALNGTDPRWKLKSILHVLTLLASLLSISLFASSIPLWNANFFHNKGPISGDWTDGISLGPLVFTFVVTLAGLTNTVIKRRPCPPRVAIAITALILLSLAPSLILAGHGSLFKHWRPPAIRSQSGVLRCNLMNIFTRDCEPILYRVGELQIGGIVFGTITWFLVFITFLISLYDHRASQVGDLRKGKSRGLKRLTLMVNPQRRYRDAEKGAPWAGSRSSHTHTSSSGSRSSQRSREHSHEKRREQRQHRQHGTKRHYRSGVKDGSGDVVPFVYMKEPEMAHPGTRYM